MGTEPAFTNIIVSKALINSFALSNNLLQGVKAYKSIYDTSNCCARMYPSDWLMGILYCAVSDVLVCEWKSVCLSVCLSAVGCRYLSSVNLKWIAFLYNVNGLRDERIYSNTQHCRRNLSVRIDKRMYFPNSSSCFTLSSLCSSTEYLQQSNIIAHAIL